MDAQGAVAAGGPQEGRPSETNREAIDGYVRGKKGAVRIGGLHIHADGMVHLGDASRPFQMEFDHAGKRYQVQTHDEDGQIFLVIMGMLGQLPFTAQKRADRSAALRIVDSANGNGMRWGITPRQEVMVSIAVPLAEQRHPAAIITCLVMAMFAVQDTLARLRDAGVR
jgi:hypothetical protein